MDWNLHIHIPHWMAGFGAGVVVGTLLMFGAFCYLFRGLGAPRF